MKIPFTDIEAPFEMFDGCWGVTFGGRVVGPCTPKGSGFIVPGLADGVHTYCTQWGAVFVPGNWTIASNQIGAIFKSEAEALKCKLVRPKPKSLLPLIQKTY